MIEHLFESWCLSPWLRCPFSRGGVYLFSHLRVASSFSRRYGTATPTALVARAADAGQGMAALTDRDGVWGAAEHVRAVVLLGPDSDVGRALAQERPGRARELLAVWLATGAQTVVAPHDHGAPGQRRLARDMVRLADRERLLTVLTNAVR